MTADARTRIAAVVRLELMIQRREPLTVLYVLVLGLLSAAFAGAGPIELVRGRGTVPRDAAWALMLASTSLTAFGQVITTMVAATVVLRDRADRIAELLITTQLTSREYLTGKLVAALMMLCLIYAAIPIGLATGAVIGGGQPGAALVAILPPFVLVVLPTMLAVGALQFAVGVLSGRLWAIVGLGLALIWLWSASAGASSTSAAVAMLDPFGSAPLLIATRAWTDAERASLAMPVTLSLLANRALWLSLGALAAVSAIRNGGRHRVRRAIAAQTATEARLPVPAVGSIERAGEASPGAGALATARYVSRWMLRDTGWRVLAALGATNVAVHAWLDARGAVSAAEVTSRTLAALMTHSRLFLILLATIYAGELVWREREERSAAQFDVLPIGAAALLFGRVSGVIAAQAVLTLILAATAMLAGAIAGLRIPAVPEYFTAVLQHLAMPFVLWMLVALAVHALVQQKLVGHLLLIAAWVAGVLFPDAAGVDFPTRLPGSALALAGFVSLALAGLGWIRGDRRLLQLRWREAATGTEKL